jgi:myo-inositol 2-dehydrogenase/D-chiro-inositol 1-dehydrogenase
VTDRRLRVAVVGTGEWWGREHARVWSKRNDADLCAVVGRTADKAEQRAAEFDTTAYTDLDHMLTIDAPDLVSVCLPNEGHFGPSLQIIEAGYPLLVEKPLEFDLDEADRLLAAAAERELFFAINFNHRYARAVQMAADDIAAGRLGEIVFATCASVVSAGRAATCMPI